MQRENLFSFVLNQLRDRDTGKYALWHYLRETSECLNDKVKYIKQEANYDVSNVHISRKVGQLWR